MRDDKKNPYESMTYVVKKKSNPFPQDENSALCPLILLHGLTERSASRDQATQCACWGIFPGYQRYVKVISHNQLTLPEFQEFIQDFSEEKILLCIRGIEEGQGHPMLVPNHAFKK